MDPDVCRNCGHSGKHIDFRDARCAITERDDAERDKLQADAALERARQLCDTSLALMKRQMQEFEDVNAAIDTLERALAAAEDRRERVRRDCGTHADVCRTARSNLQAAEEMAISAAGRYFQAGRAVTALEEREQLRASAARVDEAPAAIPMEEDDEEEGGTNDDGGEEEAAREAEDKKWQRSNERFCKWLRQSEAQRQILKSSWTKMRVAERLALAGEDVVDNHGDDNDDDDEEVARRKRVQEWAAARRLTDQLPPEEDPTMETEYLESEHLESEPEESEPPAEVVMAPPPPPAAPSPAKTAPTRRAPASRTRAKTEKAAKAAAAATATQTTPPTPARGRALRTARRVESQTRSEPTRPTTATTAATKTKKEPATTRKPAPATKTGGTTTAASSDGAGGRPAARTRARTGKTPGPGPGTGTVPAEAAAAAAAATTPGRPQRVTRRRSARVQPYPQPNAQPRWK